MSKYTTEVRYICESNAGLYESVGMSQVDEIIEKSWDKIFTTKCEFFDENYRSILCKKILKHYYLREIGTETVGVWILWVNTRLEEIMPYYNEVYKSALLEFNPFNDVDVTREHEEKIVKYGNVVSTGKSIDKYSDTPQGGIKGLEDGTYLTNANIGDSKGTVKTDNDDTIKFTEKYIGKQGSVSYSKLLQEFRKTMLNIDMMVINDFNDLFMLLW